MTILGDNTICTTSNNYSISNLPFGATAVQWSLAPNVATINSPNSPQTTLTATGVGLATLTATITNCNNTSPLTISKTVGFGNYFPQGITTATSNYNTYNGTLLSSYTYFLPSGQWGITTFNITDPNYSSFSWTPISVPSGSSWST